MEKDIKILIVPDVHGRDFWREPVKKTLEETDAKIVFLGDYIDPYMEEFIKRMEDDTNFDCKIYTIEVLKDIIELKHKFSDRIILLQGNHDAGYSIGRDVCQARRDYTNANMISKIFEDNWSDFQLAYEETINKQKFVFSHAGISMHFMKFYYEINKKSKVVDYLNNIWLAKYWRMLLYLGAYDSYRGYGGTTWASPIWADMRQMVHLDKKNTVGSFQIVGHTQLSADGEPLISKYIGDFDCRECFYINSKGKILNYKTDKIVRD